MIVVVGALVDTHSPLKNGALRASEREVENSLRDGDGLGL